MSAAEVNAGVCLQCGCSEEAPCSICRLYGKEGFFHDLLRTCCTAEPCIRAHKQELKAALARANAEKRQFVGGVAERFRKGEAKLREKVQRRITRRKKARKVA